MTAHLTPSDLSLLNSLAHEMLLHARTAERDAILRAVSICSGTQVEHGGGIEGAEVEMPWAGPEAMEGGTR